jgi:NAD(P)-dependent dehydrogenase (short-subunit alcohol dehydrogenase family)
MSALERDPRQGGGAASVAPADGSGGARATGRRTAVVTGASKGLGRVLAGFLAAQGYRLVVTARGAADVADARAELARHTDVVSVVGDVTDAEHRDAIRRAAGPRVDLLVHNASWLGPAPLPSLSEVEPQAVRDLMETNVVAPIALTQAMLPALRAARGMIVAVSSDAAVGGYPHWGAYGASKAALDLVTATWASELSDLGVTAVSVDPGDMRTDMHQAAYPGEDILDRPLPEVTLPFWAWLLGRRPEEVRGRRFQAQAETWGVAT